jgi:flagellar biogenesis protein FliO
VEVAIRLVLSLALIVGAMLALTWFGKRSRGGPNGLFTVHARLPIAKGASLAVIQVGDRFFLVGVGEKGIDLISELDGQDVLPAAKDPADSPLATGAQRIGTMFAALKDARSGNLRRAGGATKDLELDEASLGVLAGLDLAAPGPGTGLLDKARFMTTRSYLRRPSRGTPS